MAFDLFDEMRHALRRACENGTAFEDVQKKLRPSLRQLAWWVDEATVWNVETHRKNKAHPGAEFLEVIYSTYLGVWTGAKNLEQSRRVQRLMPLLRYAAYGCDRHAAWDNLVLAVDDGWWEIHFPPNGWFCTCLADSLSHADLERYNYRVGVAPPVRMVSATSPINNAPIELPEDVEFGFVGPPTVARADALLRLWLQNPRIAATSELR